MGKYAEIIGRLEKATGPDRVFDLDIHMAACPDLYPEKWYWDDEVLPPPLTASIDAAVALVERMLPESMLEMAVYEFGKPHLGSVQVTIYASAEGQPIDQTGGNLPIAIVLALFRALEARNGDA